MPETTLPKILPPADDDLDELPPMDGGEEIDPAIEEGDALDDLEDGGDPLDDATGEDDPVDASEIDAKGSESGWLTDADDAEALDVGTSDLASFDEPDASPRERDPRLDFEELGVGDEDFGLLADDGKAELDAGEEGPVAADEELREEDLPQLDADEEGEIDDAELIDAGFAQEPAAIPWAAQPWEPVGAPLDVGPSRAIACAGRGVVVATARALVRVDLEGACEPLAAVGLETPVARIAALGDAIAVVTTTGELLVSPDGGATFRSSWRDRASLSTGGASDVAFADGALWTRTRGGALLRSVDLGVVWEAMPIEGRVVAIAADERGGLAVLVADADGERVHARRGIGRDDATSVESLVPIDASAALITARAAHVAHSTADGGVTRDGIVLARIAGCVAITLLDEAGSLLVAAYRDTDDTTALLRVSPEGDAEIVADVSGTDWHGTESATPTDDDADGRVRALVRDDAHGVVWACGGFGVLALEPRHRVS
jgi:hypothetical protein